MKTNFLSRGTLYTFLLIIASWSLFIIMGGENPANAITYILTGAFGDVSKLSSISNILFLWVLTGLAYLIPAWTGMFNLGGDAQLLLGALGAAIIPQFIQTDAGLVNIIIALIVSAIIGGVWGLWPAVLRATLGINEVVTTLLSNYVILFFTNYLVTYPFKAPGQPLSRTAIIPETFKIGNMGGSNFSYTIVIVIVVLVAVELLRRYTVLGYRFQSIGGNELFAQQGGVKINKLRALSMVIGGGCAGMAGGLMVLAVKYSFVADFSPGYGFTGLLIALIANNLPLLVLLIGIIFSALQIGSLNLQMMTSIPSEVTGVFQSIIVLFVAARKSMNKLDRKGVKK